DYAPAYLFRGIAHADIGDRDAAMADYSKAIELEPGNVFAAFAYLNRGSAHMAVRDLDAAIPAYSKAIELEARNTHRHPLPRGRAYQRKGDGNRGLADFKKAGELEPNKENSPRAGVPYLKNPFDPTVPPTPAPAEATK